jgi:hypothetical protein
MSQARIAEEIKLDKIDIPPHPEWPSLSKEDKQALKDRIRNMLKEQNAVLVAHYYTDGDLQELAEETGGCVADSLEMARFGAEHHATTLVVCGVRFMGETAKILNPESASSCLTLMHPAPWMTDVQQISFPRFVMPILTTPLLFMPIPALRLRPDQTGL